MSDELRPCPFCGREAHKTDRGYTTCTACVDDEGWISNDLWNTSPEGALRAEIAKYRGMEVENASLKNDNEGLRAEIAALKAELAKYTEPLTDETAVLVAKLRGSDGTPGEFYQDIDSAIRAVRGGGK